MITDLSLRYRRPKEFLSSVLSDQVSTYPNTVPPVVPVSTDVRGNKSMASVCDSWLQYSLRIQLFSAQGLSEPDVVSVCAVLLNRGFFSVSLFLSSLKNLTP